MREIELSAASQVERMGHTSKGDQPKWQVGTTWYKADHMGYESLAEVVASRMLARSTIRDFVDYEPIRIRLGDRLVPGCMSQNFRGKQETLIPLERLHRAYHGVGLADRCAKLPDVGEKIRYTVEFVEVVTGLTGFGRYLGTILELDAFLLNEDRHTNNLAVIRNDETKDFRLCPLFDHGLSLLSDINDYPLDSDAYTCIEKVKAKPFAEDFSAQAEAAAELYGSDLHFSFSARDVDAFFVDLGELYDQAIVQRAALVLREQMRKYGYLLQ